MTALARGCCAGLLAALIAAVSVRGQAQTAAPAASATPRDTAPFDLTGYWTAVVTEDWRWRMVTPRKGDYASVPLNAKGRALADTWEPNRAGQGCKVYGAPGVMRMPLRLRISWADGRTLKIETDRGRQTRLLHFDAQTRRPESPSSSTRARAIPTPSLPRSPTSAPETESWSSWPIARSSGRSRWTCSPGRRNRSRSLPRATEA